MDNNSLDLNNLLGPLQELMKQLEGKNLQELEASIDQEQLQKFLAGTVGIVQDNLKPEEQKALAELMKNVLNMAQGFKNQE